MTTKYIWVKGQRYYLYEIYKTYNEARKTANYYKKRNKKNKHFIIKMEKTGGFGPAKTVCT